MYASLYVGYFSDLSTFYSFSFVFSLLFFFSISLSEIILLFYKGEMLLSCPLDKPTCPVVIGSKVTHPLTVGKVG